MKVEVRPLAYSPALFGPLVAEGSAGDGRFLQRLADDWQTGEMRFDGPGEILLGALVGDALVGVGGISRDPYVPANGLGRVRHVYVMRSLRGGGIGRALMEQLIHHAREHFSALRLTTEAPEAVRLYESFGFTPTSEFKASHRLNL